ncbi:hypothetical protein Taro_052950 [Colocasia esculenta]|uniref:Uncharacterized protein n=1 Tax=Colocasia esculenta TaxID=4460 RepID=A0A843XLQ2_COLES|nr:hypothetical protein [Colocasia esculenta]
MVSTWSDSDESSSTTKDVQEKKDVDCGLMATEDESPEEERRSAKNRSFFPNLSLLRPVHRPVLELHKGRRFIAVDSYCTLLVFQKHVVAGRLDLSTGIVLLSTGKLHLSIGTS